jgi:hypothetical protein
MRKMLQRKTIYGATIVAILLLVGGFAVANFINTITVNTTGQNTGTTSGAASTVWGSGAVTVSLKVATSSAACDVSPTAATATPVYLIGGAACAASGSTEWYEEFVFPPVTYPAAGLDTFYFYVVGGYSGSASQTFTITGSGTDVTNMVLTVYLDMGPATGNPSQIGGGISFTVTGS